MSNIEKKTRADKGTALEPSRKRKHGNTLFEIDTNKIEYLASIGCTYSEIAIKLIVLIH